MAVITAASTEKLISAARDNAESLTTSGSAAFAGLASLASAYQDLATRNAGKLAASFTALSAVKTPAEFFEVQQKLAKESIEAAVADSQTIAALTASVFTAALGNSAFAGVFEQVQQQVGALQGLGKKTA